MFIGIGLPITRRGFLAPTPFAGILDQLSTSPSGAWSMSRALLASYVGSPLFDLRRSSDNGTLTINAGDDGEADTSDYAAWAGADTIYVTKCYDQSGNGNHAAQGTAGKQPFFSLSGGPNGQIAFTPNVSGRQLLIPNSAPLTDTFITGGGSLYYAWLSGAQARQLPQTKLQVGGAYQFDMGNHTAAGIIVNYRMSNVQASWRTATGFATNSPLVLTMEYDGTSTSNKPAIYVDGASISVSIQVAPNGTPVAYSGSDQFPHNGISTGIYCAEWIYFNAILSSGDRGTLNDDMVARYKP